jgi:hypothetical protein
LHVTIKKRKDMKKLLVLNGGSRGGFDAMDVVEGFTSIQDYMNKMSESLDEDYLESFLEDHFVSYLEDKFVDEDVEEAKKKRDEFMEEFGIGKGGKILDGVIEDEDGEDEREIKVGVIGLSDETYELIVDMENITEEDLQKLEEMEFLHEASEYFGILDLP